MATKKNPSVPSEHLPTDRELTEDGRKLEDLPHVGVSSPDADPDTAESTRAPLRDPRVDKLDVDERKRR